jgi:hypothetical protein
MPGYEGMDACTVCGALGFWRDDERAWLCSECWLDPASRPRNAKMQVLKAQEKEEPAPAWVEQLVSERGESRVEREEEL